MMMTTKNTSSRLNVRRHSTNQFMCAAQYRTEFVNVERWPTHEGTDKRGRMRKKSDEQLQNRDQVHICLFKSVIELIGHSKIHSETSVILHHKLRYEKSCHCQKMFIKKVLIIQIVPYNWAPHSKMVLYLMKTINSKCSGRYISRAVCRGVTLLQKMNI